MSRIAAAIAKPLLVLGLLATPVGGHAQDKPANPKSRFFETVQVNLISVDVFVTDREGRPVLGLRPEDFEVFEDGRPVKITNFFAAVPGAAAVPSPAPGEDVAREADAEEPQPVEQRLSVVVLVDNSGISGADRALAMRRARDLLAGCLKVQRSQAMVVTLETRARVRQEFSADPVVVEAAMGKVESEPTNAASGTINTVILERAMSRISVPAQTQGDFSTGSQNRRAENRDFDIQDALSILQAIRSNAEAERETTHGLLTSLVNFVNSLAGMPGRKVVIYVGNGLNLHPGESLLMKWASRFGAAGIEPGFSPALEASRLSLGGDFRDLVARANADRVTFYAIDATGATPLAGATAEKAELDPDPVANLTEGMGRQTSLQYLTHATGGTTIVATPNPSAALAATLQDFDSYYSLAYPAPRIGDGKSHAIKVKIHRDGVKVRYRQNYLDKTADDRVVDRNLAALMRESGSNSLGVEVVVGAPVQQKGKEFAVPVIVAVPIGGLVLSPEGDTHHGSISIFLSAKDLDDRVTPPVKKQFPIDIPKEKLQTAMGQKAACTFVLLMARGPQTVAVSVRDDLAQAESTVTARFTVGEHAKPAPPRNG